MSLKSLQLEQTKILDQIDLIKNLCKDLKGNDSDVVTTALLKKSASGQHGIKDNGKVTRKQLREGLEKRIDILKLELKQVNKKIEDLI